MFKNIAAAQFRLRERLQRAVPKKTNKKKDVREKEVLYFLQESLKNAGEAIQDGSQVHIHAWVEQLQERRRECAQLLWKCLAESPTNQNSSVQVQRGRLNEFCWDLDGPIRAEFFLKYGRFTQKAVQYQENGHFKESLQLLHDNHLAIERVQEEGRTDRGGGGTCGK